MNLIKAVHFGTSFFVFRGFMKTFQLLCSAVFFHCLGIPNITFYLIHAYTSFLFFFNCYSQCLSQISKNRRTMQKLKCHCKRKIDKEIGLNKSVCWKAGGEKSFHGNIVDEKMCQEIVKFGFKIMRNSKINSDQQTKHCIKFDYSRTKHDLRSSISVEYVTA